MTAFKHPVVEAGEDFEFIVSPPASSHPQEDLPTSTATPNDHRANSSTTPEPLTPNPTTSPIPANAEPQKKQREKEEKDFKSLLSALGSDPLGANNNDNNTSAADDDNQRISDRELLLSIVKTLRFLLLYLFFSNPFALFLALAVMAFLTRHGDHNSQLPGLDEVVAGLRGWVGKISDCMRERARRRREERLRRWRGRGKCRETVYDKLNRSPPSDRKRRFKVFVFGMLLGAFLAVLVYRVVAAHHFRAPEYQTHRFGGVKSFGQPRWRYQRLG